MRADPREVRSPEAKAYRRWYWTPRWKRRRRAQLKAHPFCVRCAEAGHVRLATVADHVTPHKGDERAFWHGELQSLCAPHHNSDKQREERFGGPLGVDADGWPLTRPWVRGS